MSLLLFGNNFSTTLVSSIGTGDTSMTITSAAGLPVISGDQYYVLSLFDAATQLITEILHVTARTGTVLTIVRAQEGTAAASWAAGSIVSWEWTAGQAGTMVQQFQAQAQAGNYAPDTGAANAVTAAFTPALTSHIVGAPLRVLIAHTNTGATTFNQGVSAVTVTAPDGSALIAGDIVAGDIVEFVYNGTSYDVAVVQATTTRIGITRLATVAETQTGSSTTTAVTPAGLNATIGTAAYKAASDNSEPSLASVHGATVANNVTIFKDTDGTVEDSGVPIGSLGFGPQDPATPGYMTIGNVLFQWGTTTSALNIPTVVTLPTPFADTDYVINTSILENGTAASGAYVVIPSAFQTSASELTTWWGSNSGAVIIDWTIAWMAVGRKP